MSAFTPPSLSQIVKMRETASKAKYYRVNLDNSDLILDSKRCIIIWDDANQILHALTHNSDMGTTASAPIKMISADYGKICSITGNFEGGT